MYNYVHVHKRTYLATVHVFICGYRSNKTVEIAYETVATVKDVWLILILLCIHMQ